MAPVRAAEPVVSWPQPGQPVESTTLALSPPRPLSLDVTVDCAALRDIGSGTALATGGAGANGQRGLTASAVDDRIVVRSGGGVLLDEPVPRSGCRYQVQADDSGIRVLRDGVLAAERAGEPVPQVAALSTDLDRGRASDELRVVVRPDDRYSSSPGTTKIALLVLHGAALLATLLLATRAWPRVRGVVRTPRPRPVDGVVAAVATCWVALAPAHYDDSWYSLMARNAGEAGYIGNYTYMFNATENPFVASQYLMQLWGELGDHSVWWLRLLPLGYGLLTWVLLRCLLATALGRTAQHAAVRTALALAFLVWWLPFGLTLRPEPPIICLSAGVLLACEVARRARSIPALAVAVLCAAVAVACSPSGIVAFAPVLVTATPWVADLLRRGRWTVRLGVLLVPAAAASVFVPLGFGDAAFADVVEATELHRWYYLSYSWFDEWVHFGTLMAGPWALRLPVLLTIAAGVLVAIGRGRHPVRPGTVRWLVSTSAVTTLVAFALLSLSPTKWALHYSAVAAPAVLLLTGALLRSPLGRDPGRMACAAGTGVLIALVAAGFAGPNVWKPLSDRGQPFGDHADPAPTKADLDGMAPHLGEFYFRDVRLWVAVALAALLVAHLRRRRGRTRGAGPDRAVLITASLGLVSCLLTVFAFAPLNHAPGWTPAAGAVQALAGNRDGMAADVQVLAGAQTALGRPDGPVQRTGGFAGEEPAPLPAPAAGSVWHDRGADGTAEPGSLRTGWYSVPARRDGTHVVVPLAGPGLDAHRVALEIATPDGVRSVPLRPEPVAEPRYWQEVGTVLPPEARAVRVTAEGGGDWAALGEPRLAAMRPATEITAGKSVFVDQVLAAYWPGVQHAPIRGGMLVPPEIMIRAEGGIPADILRNPVRASWGGTYADFGAVAVPVRMHAELPPGSTRAPSWGRVERVVYDDPPGGLHRATEQHSRDGWQRLPTLAREEYIGREDDG
nr:arabinosyltransferase domain-containing protein [Saccharopolyspora sp. HNM0983]